MAIGEILSLKVVKDSVYINNEPISISKEFIRGDLSEQIVIGKEIALSRNNFTNVNEVLTRIDKDLYVATTLLTTETHHVKAKLYNFTNEELDYRLTNIRTLATRIQTLTRAFQMLKEGKPLI